MKPQKTRRGAWCGRPRCPRCNPVQPLALDDAPEAPPRYQASIEIDDSPATTVDAAYDAMTRLGWDNASIEAEDVECGVWLVVVPHKIVQQLVADGAIDAARAGARIVIELP